MWDMQERGRIRTALLGYMQAHQIGVPRLSVLVSKANPRNPEVPLKTLQRFLAAEMRTNDAFVGMCAKFAETCPAVDPVAKRASALAALIGQEEVTLAGAYEMRVHDRDVGTFSVAAPSLWVTFGGLHYEGIITKSHGVNLAICKDTVAGLPLTLSLTDDLKGVGNLTTMASKLEAFEFTLGLANRFNPTWQDPNMQEQQDQKQQFQEMSMAPYHLSDLYMEARALAGRDGTAAGIPILHIAIGGGEYSDVKAMVEAGASFGPDRFGRWPSVVAAECKVSEEMCDLVVEAEAEWLAHNPK